MGSTFSLQKLPPFMDSSFAFASEMLLTIPNELIPKILSNFSNEKDFFVLGVCSCVCKRWNSLVEPYLTSIHQGKITKRTLRSPNQISNIKFRTSLLLVGDPPGSPVSSGTSANTFGVLGAKFLWGNHRPNPSRLIAPDVATIDGISFDFYEHKWNNKYLEKQPEGFFTEQNCLIFYYHPNIRDSFEFMVNSIALAQKERCRDTTSIKSITVGQCSRRTTTYEVRIPSFNETPIVIAEIHETETNEKNRVVGKYEGKYIAFLINCPFKVVNVKNRDEVQDVFSALALEVRKIDSYSRLSDTTLNEC